MSSGYLDHPPLTSFERRLAGILKSVEFCANADGREECPWCSMFDTEGHADSCEIAAALAEAKRRGM